MTDEGGERIVSDQIKVPLTITLKAGDVVVAEEVHAALWSFVLGVLLNPPNDLPPLPEGFLPKGYKVFP